MSQKQPNPDFQDLPQCACDFIKLVIKKMKYRKKVRDDVANELIAHFQDELAGYGDDKEKEQKALKLIEEFGDAKMLGVLLRRAKKRNRTLWETINLRMFQILGISVLLQIIYLTWFFSGRPAITTDYVAQLNKMVQPTADESLNAAPLYNKAVELYVECPNDIQDFIRKAPFDSNMTAEQKQLLEKWVSDNSEAVDLIIAGNQRPYYWEKYEVKEKMGPIYRILLPQLSGFRNLTYLLCHRAFIEAEKGQYESAFNYLISCYRFGSHIKKGSCLVEHLVGIAIRSAAVDRIRTTLSKYQINLPVLADLQKSLENEIANDDFMIKFNGEKLFLYDLIQRCFTKGIFDSGHLYLKNFLLFIWECNGKPRTGDGKTFLTLLIEEPYITSYALFKHPNKQNTIKMVDYNYDLAEELMKKTPAQLNSESIDLKKYLFNHIKGNLFLETLMPSYSKIHQIMWRSKTDVENTLAIIGVLRYQKDTGNYPDNLQEVVKAGYLKAEPIDPFSDKPLIYKKTKDGFTLYSVGLNFIDDGGIMEIDKYDNKPRSWAENGDEVFWPVQK